MLYKEVAVFARTSSAFPELLPVTGFHQENALHTYSGGTVWELHPIILFSSQSHTPCLPRNWYSLVIANYKTFTTKCQQSFSERRMNVSAKRTNENSRQDRHHNSQLSTLHSQFTAASAAINASAAEKLTQPAKAHRHNTAPGVKAPEGACLTAIGCAAVLNLLQRLQIFATLYESLPRPIRKRRKDMRGLQKHIELPA